MGNRDSGRERDDAQRQVERAVFRQRSWLRHVGLALVIGPRAIHPPKDRDNFGWLEPDFRLRYWRGFAFEESIAVYTDNTINRDTGFLQPVIRYTKWERRTDINSNPLPAWPSVEVVYSYFAEHQDRVSDRMRAMQVALAHAPFVPYGLSADRTVAEFENRWPERLAVFTDNGDQTLEFVTSVLPEGDPLTDLFFATFADLRSILVPISREGWREVYDEDITAYSPNHSWDWDGRPVE